MSRFLQVFKTITSVVIAACLLGSCYMPMKFDIEVELTREGFYSMIFDGYIVKVAFYDEIRQKKIEATDIRTKAESFRKSLSLDPSVKSVKYIQQGVYQIHWEKTGDILQSKFVTFMQRNENMLSLKYVKTKGTVQLAGTSASQDQRKRVSEMGLDSSGQIRFITNAKIVGHNANRVIDYATRGPRFMMYIWDIDSVFSPTPNLTVSMH